jgi:hypothetical protein
VGFVLAGLALNIGVIERMKFGKVMLIGEYQISPLGLYSVALKNCKASCFQIVGYTVQIIAPPFPIMALAFGVNGFGWCIQVRLIITYRFARLIRHLERKIHELHLLSPKTLRQARIPVCMLR